MRTLLVWLVLAVLLTSSAQTARRRLVNEVNPRLARRNDAHKVVNRYARRLPSIEHGLAVYARQLAKSERQIKGLCTTNAECLKRGLPLLKPAKLYTRRDVVDPLPTNTGGGQPIIVPPSSGTAQAGAPIPILITTDGSYYIQALGGSGGDKKADGGSPPQYLTSGGARALVQGVFELSAGTNLVVYVGRQGVLDDGQAGAGGGGGTFIFTNIDPTHPILVAGGGGGAADTDGVAASLTPDGTASAASMASPLIAAVPQGGTGGSGGQAEFNSQGDTGTGGSGAGYSGDGQPATLGDVGGTEGVGGKSLGGGFVGGTGPYAGGPKDHGGGGYGGGGSGGLYGGGGAGGYSGGAASGEFANIATRFGGGGGGSFIADWFEGNPVTMSSIALFATEGDGFVQVTLLT